MTATGASPHAPPRTSTGSDAADDGPEPPARGLRAAVGRRPVLLATAAGLLGLLGQAAAYAIGWGGDEGTALTTWYVALVALVLPFSVLLTAPRLGDRQRLAGSVVLGLLLHLSWLLSNPVMSTRFDESLHVTTLLSMLDGDGWFAPNTMLPVSPHYPGLELATAGVHWTTGLPLVVCQSLVVAVARVTLVVALFLLASRIGRSTRVGSVVVLLYAGSAQFYFFNVQYSYQTVAIAMLMAALLLLLRASDSPDGRPWVPMVAAQACLAALTITHHLTGWLTLGALWVLAALFYAGGERRRGRLTLVTAEVGTVVAAAWTALVAPLLFRYLGPIFDHAGSEVAQLLALDGGGRDPLADSSGEPTAAWEVAVMLGSIVLWCVLLLPSLWGALRGTTVSRSSARLLPLGLAAAYPFLQLARFSPTASEVADRASTFVAMAMALVVGLWVVRRAPALGPLLPLGAVLLVLGGVLLGYGPAWQRVPGPYLAGAEQRSVDADTVAAARWAGRHLPEGSRIAADVTTNRVWPNFAPVEPVTGAGGSENVTPLFIARTFGEDEVDLVREAGVDFLVVDTRMAGETVRTGHFFEAGSAFGPEAATLDPAALAKFADAPGLRLVLDGPVQVFDARPLRGEPTTFESRPDPGMPGDWSPWRAVLAGLALAGLLAVGLRQRRRWSVLPLALTLPVLMVVGAVGMAARFLPAAGSAVLLGAVVAALVADRRRGGVAARRPGPPWPRDPWRVPLAAGCALLLVASVVVASVSAWHGMEAPSLPPPSTGSTG